MGGASFHDWAWLMNMCNSVVLFLLLYFAIRSCGTSCRYSEASTDDSLIGSQSGGWYDMLFMMNSFISFIGTYPITCLTLLVPVILKKLTGPFLRKILYKCNNSYNF